MNIFQRLFIKAEPVLSLEAAKAMYSLCSQANEHLSKQNYEGMLEAQEDLINLQKVAKKSGIKTLKVLANSAAFNIGEARKNLEGVIKHSSPGINFNSVPIAFRYGPDLQESLQKLYSDWQALTKELERYGGKNGQN